MRGPNPLDRAAPWLASAFGIALLDVLIALWPAPPAYRYPPALLRAVGLNMALAAVALVAARAALRPVARRTGQPVGAVAVAAVAWAWMILLAAAPSSGLFQPGLCPGDAIVCGAHLSRVLPVALAITPILAATARAAGRVWREPGGGRVMTATVPVLALAVPAEWWIVYGNHPRGLSGTWPSLVVIAVVTGLLWAAVRRGRGRGVMRLTAGASLLAVVLVPAWLPLWALGRSRTSAPATGGEAPELVLLITVDALRADALALDPAGHTPHLAALARDSVVFTKAVSPSSWTLPAFASLLTGVSPAVHLVDASGRLPAAIPTLPEILRRYGYTTGAIVENPLFAPPSEFAGRFDDTAPLAAVWYGASPMLPMSVGPRTGQALFAAGRRQSGASAVTDLALAWLRRAEWGRAFLWVHYMGPHAPYTPAAVAAAHARVAAGPGADAARTAYFGEVVEADTAVGSLLQGLRQTGRFDGALIILTADHGEELGERGETGHGRHLHAEVLDVPLLVKYPRSRGGRVETARVSTQSVPATVLDACGIPYDAGMFESRSLAGLAAGRPGEAPDEPTSWLLRFYRGGGRPQAAVFLGGFKYVRLFDPDEERLFAVDADPQERKAVTREHPEVVDLARRRLAEERERADRLRRRLRITDPELKSLDPERIKTLRALGYLQ